MSSSSSPIQAPVAGVTADLLDALDGFEGTIPDPVLQHYLEKCGCICPDPTARKIIGLATQK